MKLYRAGRRRETAHCENTSMSKEDLDIISAHTRRDEATRGLPNHTNLKTDRTFASLEP
jgi:hypothetical protein